MTALVRTANSWRFHLAIGPVSQVCLDYAVTLRLESGVIVRIEVDLVLSEGGEETTVDPEGPVDQLAPVVRMTRAVVSDCEAFDDGRLEIHFQGGMLLKVAASDEYEAWELAGPEGLLVVSNVGGGLSVWTPPSPASLPRDDNLRAI